MPTRSPSRRGLPAASRCSAWRRRLACLADFTRVILGPSVRLYFDQAVYKKPFCEQVVPWHQDNGYNPKVPADYVSLWVALTT